MLPSILWFPMKSQKNVSNATFASKYFVIFLSWNCTLKMYIMTTTLIHVEYVWNCNVKEGYFHQNQKVEEIVELGDGWCQSEEYCLKSLLHIIQYIGTERGAKVGANICQKSNKSITKHYTELTLHFLRQHFWRTTFAVQKARKQKTN